MKHFFILLFACFVSLAARGQFMHVHALRYRVDTFHFHNLSVPKQRYEQRDLNSIPDKNTQERILAANIGYLQSALDQMNRYIIEGKDVFHNLEAGEGHIRDIRNTDPTFDCTLYENELYAYKKIADTRYDVADKLKQKEAGEQAAYLQAEEAEKQRQKDELEAMAVAWQQHADSVEAALVAQQVKKEHTQNLKKYGAVNGKAINNGKVLLGMTPAMCTLAWGQPFSRSKSTTAKGVTEKWFYTREQFLVFTNGRVTTIHEGGLVKY